MASRYTTSLKSDYYHAPRLLSKLNVWPMGASWLSCQTGPFGEESIQMQQLTRWEGPNKSSLSEGNGTWKKAAGLILVTFQLYMKKWHFSLTQKSDSYSFGEDFVPHLTTLRKIACSLGPSIHRNFPKCRDSFTDGSAYWNPVVSTGMLRQFSPASVKQKWKETWFSSQWAEHKTVLMTPSITTLDEPCYSFTDS